MASSSTAQDAGFDILITMIFIFVAAILLFPMNKYIPFDRRLGSILGAVLCMMIVWAFPSHADTNIGTTVDFSVLIILTAIMMINFILLRQKYIRRLTDRIQNMIREDVGRGFWAVSLIALLASPFITNDGLCLMLTHPVLDAFNQPSEFRSNDRKRYCPTDKLYFMLNIACSSNIGSALTYTGNPQNIIVATYLSPYMSGGVFCLLMILPVAVSWVITINVLNRSRIRAAEAFHNDTVHLQNLAEIEGGDGDVEMQSYSPMAHQHSEMDGEVGHEHGWKVAHIPADEPAEPVERDEPADEGVSGNGSKRNKHTRLAGSDDVETAPPTATQSNGQAPPSPFISNGSPTPSLPNTPAVAGTSIRSPEQQSCEPEAEESWDVVSAPYIVFSALLIIMGIEFAGAIPLAGLFAFASIVTVVAVIVSNYHWTFWEAYVLRHPHAQAQVTETETKRRLEHVHAFLEEMFHEIDYNLLIIFIGLFIVSGSFLLTKLPQAIWRGIAGSSAFTTATSTFCICIYIVLACQLIGNVPVVYMAVDNMEDLPRHAQVFGWLIMAFVSTVAGNLTLVGSAANIIVAEKAMRHKDQPIYINALQHFKLCGPVTVLCIVIGALIISLEAVMFL